MQEGISYMAGAEIPGVIVNVQRGGPGLGTIQPSQSDYFQATRGGGNGEPILKFRESMKPEFWRAPTDNDYGASLQ